MSLSLFCWQWPLPLRTSATAKSASYQDPRSNLHARSQSQDSSRIPRHSSSRDFAPSCDSGMQCALLKFLPGNSTPYLASQNRTDAPDNKCRFADAESATIHSIDSPAVITDCSSHMMPRTPTTCTPLQCLCFCCKSSSHLIHKCPQLDTLTLTTNNHPLPESKFVYSDGEEDNTPYTVSCTVFPVPGSLDPASDSDELGVNEQVDVLDEDLSYYLQSTYIIDSELSCAKVSLVHSWRTAPVADWPDQPVEMCKPLLCRALINRLEATVLIDCRFEIDMISPSFVELCPNLVEVHALKTPLSLGMAIQGSHSSVNYGAWLDITFGPFCMCHYTDVQKLLKSTSCSDYCSCLNIT
jgi:hypothetical protein